ncbi:MAG: hypothetical protein WC943_07330 [Elusimicrobiota bacterium]|jgi:hypothetical protein
MKISSIALALTAALLAAGMTVRATEEPSGSPQTGVAEGIKVALSPRAIIQGWPKDSRMIADVVMERYGRPDDWTETALIWRAKGPWKRMIVHRKPWGARPFDWSPDVLQQTVSYRVPLNRIADLAAFDTRISVNRTTDELSSRANDERWNYLALNLADEVIVGWKTPEEAKLEYRRVRRLAEAGKSSPYIEGLRF